MSLLGRLLGRGASGSAPAVPPGYLIHAVGDVHGRDDLLADLLGQIEADAAARNAERRVLVFLGDLIDRGPASAQVIERLRSYRPDRTRLVFLCGNHEEVLLRILAGESAPIRDWLRFGGAQCLESYGVDAGRLKRMEPAQALETIRSAIPAEHVAFLREFDDSFRAGGYLFVHAGIRPGVALVEQSVLDLRWIREPFLSDRFDHGFTVVHGHTIRREVEEQGNRIGIDTGAYHHGVLTAIGLAGADRWYLQAVDPAQPSDQGGKERMDSSVLDGVSSQFG